MSALTSKSDGKWRERESPVRKSRKHTRLIRIIAREIAEGCRRLHGDEEFCTTGGVAVLCREDLLADEGNEIVIRHGGSERCVILLSSRAPVRSGRAVPHITAAGENVSGCRYVAFDDGMTVYYPSDLEFEVVHVGGYRP